MEYALLSMLAFFVIGVPIAFSMLLAAGLTMLLEGSIPLETLVQRLLAGVDFFPLLAIPFFLLMGELLNVGGATAVLVRLSRSLVGHISGGLAHVAIVANIIMAGMSGSAVSDASATTAIMVPAMERAGFSRAFAGAVTGAASIIGPIIPPSIPMVLFASITGESIGKMFAGGALPGLLMGGYLMAVTYFIARRRGYPRDQPSSTVELLKSFGVALPALCAPGVIFGGIFFGIFSPTESAAIGAVYALFLGLAVYRELKLRDLPAVLKRVAVSTAVIMVILAAAMPLGWLLAWFEIPQRIVGLFLSISRNPTVILFLVNGVLLLLGCFVESAAILILVTPTLMPLVQSLGIHPIHFGVVLVLNLMIGLLTPPVGTVLYTVMRIGKVSMEDVVREIPPFLGALVAALITIIVFPELVLWLPRRIFGL